MVAHTPVLKRWYARVLLVMVLLAFGLAVGVLILSLPGAATESATDVTTHEQDMERSNAASTARFNAMAARYAVKDASAVRYNAMARYYAAKDAAARQRGYAASTARFNAMAERYAAASQ